MEAAASIRERSSPGSRITACVTALPGLVFPDALLHTLAARSWSWSRGLPASSEGNDVSSLPLIWVDQRWAEGIEYVRHLSHRVRERAVLVGREPPRDMGPMLRSVGALTYATDELAPWLLELIECSVWRSNSGLDEPWWSKLAAAQEATSCRPLDTLRSVARLAAEQLGADGVDILVRSGDSAIRVVDLRREASKLVPWQELGARDPTPFFEAAQRYEGTVVVPRLDRAPRFAEHAASANEAVLARVFQTTDDWQSAMLLRWNTAFLPNATELSTLEALSAVAAAAWTQVLLSTESEVLKPLGSFVRYATTGADRLAPQRALVDACARIARASVAVILVRDAEEAPERLHFACEWRDAAAPVTPGCFQDLHFACPKQVEDWTPAIESAITALSLPVEVSHVLMLPCDRTSIPKGAVVLLSSCEARSPIVEVSGDLRARAAEDLLAYGWPLVERLDETFAQTVADGLSSDASLGSFGPEGVRGLLVRAAKIVFDATGADQVFAQFGADVIAYPANDAAVGIQAGRDSLTRYAREHDQAVQILDIGDAEREMRWRINASGCRELFDCLGWSTARSLIIAPIDRDRGMLKVYTKASGRFLTAGDLRIVKCVGERLRNVAGPLVQRAALHELNMLASKLAGFAGDELAHHLVAELEAWTAHYIKPDCQVYMLAQTEAGASMVAASSPELKHLHEHFVQAQSQAEAQTSFGGMRVLRERFILPKSHGLTGALFLCHKQTLSEAAEPLAREAAREIALLLHAESVRQTLLQQQGILRHGLLGPVQGIVSQAQMIGLKLAESGLLTGELADCVKRIQQEAAAVRSWRAENRLVAALQNKKRFDIRPRRSQLRLFVEDCARRFFDSAQERNLVFRLELPSGGVFAEFDPEALDIALSNLVDNAVKYAFYNRTVTVGMQLRRHTRARAIDIWVEDIGHGIPDHRKEAIYEPGTRGGQTDPFRVIRGEGLGLYLARQIAIAHDGSLIHTCECAGRPSGDTTPYRVRFTLSLPGK